METCKSITPTPWDCKVFGIDTYEINSYSEEALEEAMKLRGHFTIKVDPIASKELLHRYLFYYCDTLINPYCTLDRFVPYEHQAINASTPASLDDLIKISNGAFVYGRFHRDFNIDRRLADLRYANWLKELFDSGTVFALMYHDEVAGFLGYAENRILLHTLSEKYRSRDLAKHFWSAAFEELFSRGHTELVSSVSASNVAVLNVYASMGFRFRTPRDVYHRLNT